MSGIYISTDDDQDNIPEYLQEGIAFEFMDDHVTLSIEDGITCIINWCKESAPLNCKKQLQEYKNSKKNP